MSYIHFLNERMNENSIPWCTFGSYSLTAILLGYTWLSFKHTLLSIWRFWPLLLYLNLSTDWNQLQTIRHIITLICKHKHSKEFLYHLRVAIWNPEIYWENNWPEFFLLRRRQRIRATSDDAIPKRTATPATRYVALNTLKVSEKLMKSSLVTLLFS